MSDLLLPDSRFEMPELFYPGRKPVGNVKIDKTHKYGVYCHTAIIGTSNSKLGEPALSYTSGASNRIGEFAFDGTAGNKAILHSAIPASTELTIVTKVKRNANGNSGAIYSEKTVTNWLANDGINLNFRPDTSSIGFNVGSNSVYNDDSSIDTGNWLDIAAAWEADVAAEIYINEELITNVGGVISSSFTSSTKEARLGTYYDETTTRSLDGEIEYLFIFNKRLNKAEIVDIYRDPYQFLISA